MDQLGEPAARLPRAIVPLWQDYGLFVHSGMDTILGKGKKDISMLMTYVAADRYLKDGGKLGFVITQSVWKTAGAGRASGASGWGRRRAVRVLHVDDLTSLQVFEGASTRTSVFMLQKGQPTRYPCRTPFGRKPRRADWTTIAAGRGGRADEATGVLRDAGGRRRPTSAWLTARPKALDAVQKVLGESDYQAHAGV